MGMRPFDWLLLMFCFLVGMRFLAPDHRRSVFDLCVASSLVLLTLYVIASAVLR